MTRGYPPIPPDSTFYRIVFFAPLILVELTTPALLLCSPGVRVNAWTCYALAAMFATFTAWANVGSGYPASPSPIAANVVSKLLAFATVITLVLPLWRPRYGALPSARMAAGTLGPADRRQKSADEPEDGEREQECDGQGDSAPDDEQPCRSRHITIERHSPK